MEKLLILVGAIKRLSFLLHQISRSLSPVACSQTWEAGYRSHLPVALILSAGCSSRTTAFGKYHAF